MPRKKKPSAEVTPEAEQPQRLTPIVMGEEQAKRQHADRLTAQRRLDDFIDLRLQGAQPWDLRAFVRAKEADPASAWFLQPGFAPLSEPMIRKYAEQADAAIVANVCHDRERSINEHLARRQFLYGRAVTAGETRTALSVLQDDASLRGLYPEKKTAADDLPPLFPAKTESEE